MPQRRTRHVAGRPGPRPPRPRSDRKLLAVVTWPLRTGTRVVVSIMVAALTTLVVAYVATRQDAVFDAVGDALGDPPLLVHPYAADGLTYLGPLTALGLSAGEETSVLLDVTIPKNSDTSRFEVVLRADVNGVPRTYVLRDGHRPFTLMGLQGGAGFSPSTYYWCPGAAEGLVHHSGDGDLLDPPC